MSQASTDRRLESGDACPECGDRLQFVNSRRDEANGIRIRYVGCKRCRYRPPANRRTAPLEVALKSASGRTPVDSGSLEQMAHRLASHGFSVTKYDGFELKRYGVSNDGGSSKK